MTTNNAITDPVTLLPNTKLEQIKDRFIWYSNTAWQGGRSKKISSNQMPPHNHYYEHVDPYDRMGNPDGSKDTSGGYAANESYQRGNKEEHIVEDYMPPYYTVKA